MIVGRRKLYRSSSSCKRDLCLEQDHLKELRFVEINLNKFHQRGQKMKVIQQINHKLYYVKKRS